MNPTDNRDVYEHPDVVAKYAQEARPLKGESTLLARHPEMFRGKTVLDIGVGAGRTTPIFAKDAAVYQGLDYSSAMVAVCASRYSNLKNVSFFQDDARTLQHCPDAFFDVAVFSFNGIDTVDADGRRAVLRAVHRVLKPGGYFFFSFHNAGYLHRLYQYNWSRNPLNWRRNLMRRKRLIALNGTPDKYEGQPYFFLKDGGDDFRTEICYTRPSYQIGMLQSAGFTVSECIAAYEGGLLDERNLDDEKVPWIYLLCRKA